MAMAESHDPDARTLAANTLDTARHLHDNRHDLFASRLARNHGYNEPERSASRSIVPDRLLEHISRADNVDDAVKESAAQSLTLSQQIRYDRQAALGGEAATVTSEAGNFHRGVYDMQHHGNGSDPRSFRLLPGKAIRAEGQPASSDKVVNQAFDNCLKVLDFYQKIFNYDSLDNSNMPVISSVHFAQAYGNAFWYDGAQQMVYGDGSNFIYNFTACIDVIGHEMTVSSLNLQPPTSKSPITSFSS